MSEITIGRLRGGFSVSWTDQLTGRRRRYQLKARSKADAEREARDVYLRHNLPTGSARVSDLWTEYVNYLGSKPTARTMRSTGKPILAHFGALRPDQITIEDCRAYNAARAKSGRAPGAIHTELGHLRSAMLWAKKNGIIPSVPHIERPSKPDSDVVPISDEELRSIIENTHAPHAKLAVILLLTTAGRMSAILELTWDRVDFERGVINLRDPDGVTRKGRAVVPMNSMARAALTCAKEAALTDFVVEHGGKPIKSIRTAYSAALRRAGLEPINVHRIRHTAAVKMLAAGQPIEIVSQYLGHSNVQITFKTYARFMPEHMTDAAEVLNLDLRRPAT